MKSVEERLERIEQILVENKNERKAIFNVEEACIYLNISKSSLYKKTSKREINHYSPNGGKIYFLEKDLQDFLLKNKRSSEDIETQAENYLLNNKINQNERM